MCNYNNTTIRFRNTTKKETYHNIIPISKDSTSVESPSMRVQNKVLRGMSDRATRFQSAEMVLDIRYACERVGYDTVRYV